MSNKSKSEQKYEITASKRTVFGKKLKQFRKDGFLPANIYGEGFKSQSVSLKAAEFYKLYKKAGETHIVYVPIESDKEALPVLIHNVQKHPVTNDILHIDLRKVDLAKKLETAVPVKLIGQSDAVLQKTGVLQTISDSVLVEALPEHIPSEIEIDISVLKQVNDEIKIKDLKANKDYAFKDDPEKTVVRITEHKEEEVTPQTEAVETEVTEQKAEGEEVAAAEGEEKKEEEKKTEPQAAEKPKEEGKKE